MIKDHRPYYLKRLSHAFEQWYANHFLAPQCEHFGRHLVFMKPWGVEIYGNPVSIGDYTTLIATMDRRIRLTSWIANGNREKSRSAGTASSVRGPGSRRPPPSPSETTA